MAAARRDIGRSSVPRAHRPRGRSGRSAYLLTKAIVEALEPRVLLSYVVNTLNDHIDASTSSTVSLRDAIERANAAGGDQTITFASGLSGTITLSERSGYGALELSGGNISIQGPGANALTINADGNSGVFIVDSGATAALSGLTITGGDDSIGAGILNNGVLTLTDCVISGNTATYKGGGIGNSDQYSADANLTVIDCTISSNHSEYGGGLFNNLQESAAQMTITDSMITGNSATRGGAGIENYSAILSVNSSTISGNVGGGNGSGICNETYEHYYTAHLTVTNSIITGNSTQREGGGISDYYGVVNISNSTINNNTAQYSGGGFDNYGTTATVTNCTIAANTAASGGGIDNFRASLTVNNSTIADNTATHNSTAGGGIFDSSSTTTLTGTIVAGNNSGSSEDDLAGGGFTGSYNLIEDGSESSELTTANHNLLNESPMLSALGNFGGPTETMALLPGSPAIGAGEEISDITTDQRGASRPGTLTSDTGYDIGAFQTDPLVVNTTLDGPDASGQLSLRQAINLADVLASSGTGNDETVTFQSGLSGTITLDGSALNIDNTEGSVAINGPGASDITINAGGHGSDFTIDKYATASISGLTITGGHGGGINNNGTLSITDSTVSGNSGGGIINGNSSYSGYLTVTDCTISGNSSGRGDGIHNYGSSSTVTVANSSISGNTASQGGALANWYGSMTINDCTISGNSSYSSGGAIANYIGILTVTGSTFSDNTAGGVGGVLYDENSQSRGDTTFTNCTVTGNSSGEAGGALYLYRSNLSVVDSTITGNAAVTGAGIDSRQSSLNVADTSISGNSASQSGGGLYSYGGTASLNNSPISNNSAAAYGGGIDNRGGTFTVAGSTIHGNTATLGGGINNGGTLSITDATVSDNTGAGISNGGGIYDIAVLTLTDSTVSGNTNSGNGGGIYNYNGGALTVTDCTITGNSATSGGGIANYIATLTVTDSTVSDNAVRHSGGGIYDTYCGTSRNATITNSAITGNTADFSGGGIYIENSVASVANCTIAENSVGASGGGIFSVTSTLTVFDSTISGNSSSDGSGIYRASNDGNTKLYGTIVAGNTGGSLAGEGFSGTYNLIGTGGSGGLVNGTDHNIVGVSTADLGLAPLGDYGGTTDTMALLPSSPALDAGTTFDGPDGPVGTDQRGISRPQGSTPDIGAFESRGFTVSVASGSGQSAVVDTPFSDALVVTVAPIDSGITAADLADGFITFTAPAGSVASATFNDNPVALVASTNGSDTATVSATANSISGTYQVTASAAPSVGTKAIFALTNAAVSDLTATATTTGTINLRWINDGTVSSFNIMQSTDGTNFTNVTTVPGTTPYLSGTNFLEPGVYEVTGLNPNTLYYFEVVGVASSTASSTTNVASATTAAPGTYSTTPLETVDIPVGTGEFTANSVQSITLQAGVHYELVASGQVLCLPGWEDAEYFFDVTDDSPQANASYTNTAWPNEVGANYINAGISIDDTSLGQNHYPYWGAYNPDDVYAIDIVGTGQPLTLNLQNDFYPGDTTTGETTSSGVVPSYPLNEGNGVINSSPFEVQIFAQNPAAPSNLTATADNTNQRIILTWQNNASGETGFEIDRSTTDGNFTPFEHITTPLPGAGQTVTEYDTTAVDGTPYYYEVQALGSSENSGFSNVATAELAIPPSETGTGSISGTAYEQVSSVDPPLQSSSPRPIGDPSIALTSFTPPGYELEDDGVVPYLEDDSILFVGGQSSAPIIYEESANGTISVFSTPPTADFYATDHPIGADDTRWELSVANPGNAAGFIAGDVFLSNGSSGQIWRITDHGQSVTLFATLPTEYDLATEIFIDNTGAFGGDMLGGDADNDIFLIDANGDYAEIAHAIPGDPVAQDDGKVDGLALIAVPDDTARWGQLAGTILAFPFFQNYESVYDVYSLTLTNSTVGGNSPVLQATPFPLVSLNPTTGSTNPDAQNLSEAEYATLIPTNANFYLYDHENELYEAPASEFTGIAGDILLGEKTGYLEDVYWDSSSQELVTSQINYTPGLAGVTGLNSVAFGPPAVTSSGISTTDQPLANRPIYLDENNNGQWDPGEPITYTNADGGYSFSNLPNGTYQVAEILPGGWSQINPDAPAYTITISSSNQDVTGVDFSSELGTSLYPPVFTSAPPTSAVVGTMFTYAFAVSDPNPGDTVTYDLPEHPDGMSIQYNNGVPEIVWNVPSSPTQFAQVLLRATDSNGASAIQPFTLTLLAPSTVAVQNLTVTQGGTGALDLSWTAVPGATQYYLLRSTTPFSTSSVGLLNEDYIPIYGLVEDMSDPAAPLGEPYFNVVTQNGTVYAVDTGVKRWITGSLTANTPYYYSVIAGIGNTNFNVSSVIVSTPAAYADNDTPVSTFATPTLANPTGLTASLTSTPNNVQLTWFGNLDGVTTGYTIYRSTSDSFSGATEVASGSFSNTTTTLYNGSATTYSWTDTSPDPTGAPSNYYWVVATDAGGSSGPSNVASLSMPNADAPQHVVPAVNPITNNYSQIELTATAVNPGTGPLTYVWSLISSPSTAPGASPTFGTQVNGALGSEIVDLNAAGTYVFSVVASNSSYSSTPVQTAPYTVVQVAHSITGLPGTIGLAPGATEVFSPVVLDQFGNPLLTPVTITWSVSNSSDGSMVNSQVGAYTETSGSNIITATASAASDPAVSASQTFDVTALTNSLSAPTSVTATAIAETETQISWNPVAGANGYLITRYTLNSGGTVVAAAVINSGNVTGSNPYIDLNLAPGTTYYYTIQAWDQADTGSNTIAAFSQASAPSNDVETWPAPPAPTDVVATALSSTTVQITWQPDPNAVADHVVGYAVESESNPSVSPPTQWISLMGPGGYVTSPVYLATNAGPGTTWWYQVIALTRADLFEGTVSSPPVSVTPPRTAPGASPAPEGPYDLTGGYSGEGLVDLQWLPPADGNPLNGAPSDGVTIESYQVYQIPESEINTPTVPTAVGPTTTNTNVVLAVPSGSDNVYYVVANLDENGTVVPSAPSNSVEVNTTIAATAPNAPAIVSAVADSAGEVTITWDDNSDNEAGFNILRRLHLASDPAGLDTASWSIVGLPLVDATSFEDLSVAGGQDYDYEVQAFNYAANGTIQTANSAPANVTTPANGPTPPTDLQHGTITAYSVPLSWDAPTGDGSLSPNGYYVLRENGSATGWYNLTPTPVSGTTYTDDTVNPSSSYTYAIVSVLTDGNAAPNVSAPSTSITVTTPAAPAVTPFVNIVPVHGPDVETGTTVDIEPLSGITPIMGTVSGTGITSVTWSLVLIPSSNNTSGLGPITLTTGNSTVGSAGGVNTTGTLFSFNPSLYPAGSYELELLAYFNGSNTAATYYSNPIAIDSPVQLGNFALPVTDMTVNVPGLAPIVVSRTYNSTLQDTPSDFGYGWTLNLGNTVLTTTAGLSGMPGDGSDTSFQFGDLVYITLPDGEEHVFQFMPVPDGYQTGGVDGIDDDPLGLAYDGDSYTAQFVCVDGSDATLQVQGGDDLLYNSNYNEFTDDTGTIPYSPANADFGDGLYTLTTTDGTQYSVNAGTGEVLTSSDPAGNTTTYHYSGNALTSITGPTGTNLLTITRGPIDLTAGGTINVITSIAAGGETVYYHYDGNGNLTSVTQPQDDETAPTTPVPSFATFAYSYYSGTHLLHSVVNGLDVTVASFTFNSSGELSQIAGASGNNSPVVTEPTDEGAAYDGDTSQIVTDPDGNTTEDIYNAEGNIVREIQSVTNSDGVIIEYIVTQHQYSYASITDVETAEQYGYTMSPNSLLSETDWQPFAVLVTNGVDASGLRYTAQATEVASRTLYYFADGPGATASDIGQIESVGTPNTTDSDGASSELTGYSDYVDGQPEYITTPTGTTYNHYNSSGELLSTTTAYGTAEAATTDYLYTSAGYGVPAGLLYETEGPPPNNESGQIVVSYNTYYGNIPEGESAPPYIVQAPTPSGSTDDVAGELASTIDVNGVTHFFNYDVNGNQIDDYFIWTDPNNSSNTEKVETLTSYDGAGRVVSVTANKITALTGDTVSSPGVITNTLYNEAGQIAETQTQNGVDGSGNPTYADTFNYYDVNGNLVMTINPNGTETRTAYDSLNRPTVTMNAFYPGSGDTAPTGVIGTVTTYNSLGQVVETQTYGDVQINFLTIDPTTNIATFGSATESSPISSNQTTYNPNGSVNTTTTNVTSTSSGLGTVYQYYPNGQQESVTELNVPTWDVASNSTVPMNLSTGDIYNSVGQLYQTTNAEGVIAATYTYNNQNEVVDTLAADGVSTLDSYDAQGNKISETGPDGTTTYTYSNSGQLVEVIQPEVANGDNGGAMTAPTTTYTYDNYGDELSQTDAKGNTTTYTYDALGNMLSETLPDGQSEGWAYNQFGQVATHTDFDGNVATYTYYASGDYSSGAQAGMLEQVVYTGSGKTTQTVTYTYTNLGQQYQVTDASGTTTDSYDANGNVIEENTPEGIVNYAYNALNQQTDMWTGNVTYANRSTAVTWTQYAYDVAGRLSTVTQSRLNDGNVDLATTYGYDMLGNKIHEVDPNGDVTSWSYNEMNELASEVVTNGSNTLYSVSYILNADGTRKSDSETELQPGGTTATLSTTWTYDALDRLTGETITSSLSGGSQTETWSYDMDGNRVKQVKVAGGVTDTTTYTYNGDDQMTQQVDSVTGTTTFGYDANGSQTTTTVGGTVTQTDSYDVRNRLQKVIDSSGTTTYVYDDAGDRVQETTGSTTTYYLIDSNNPTGYAKPIEVRVGSSTGTPTTTYILGLDVIGQANSSGAVSYLVIDGRDDTRALVSSTGSVTATFNYDAFGNPIGFTAATAPTIFLFQQMMYDAPSGTDFTISRQTPLGAPYWIEADPPGYSNNDGPLTLNGYLFEDGNPISGLDPTGHFDFVELLSTIGDMATELGETAVSVYRAYRAVDAVEKAFTLVGAVVSGIENVTTGPQSLAPFYRFVIGFVGGAIQGAIALEAPTLASGVGTALIDAANVTFSDEKWNWTTLGEVIAHVAITTGITGIITAPLSKLYGETNIENFLISADVTFIADDVKGFSNFWKNLRV